MPTRRSVVLAFGLLLALLDGTVSLADGSVVARGIVRDGSTNGPVGGAALMVVRGKDAISVAKATSDASGAFELPCSSGAWVEIRARGFVTTRRPLICGDDLRYALLPGVQFEGRVVSPDGLPADGAQVACTEGIQIRPEAETIADQLGHFALVCQDGDLRLSAHHPSGAPVWQRIGTVSAGTARMDLLLTLEDGRRLTGRVVGSDGEPLSTQVLILDKNARKHPTLVRTNALGAFEATIGYAERTVVAVAEDGRAVKKIVPAGLITGVPLELRLPVGEILQGRIEGDATGAVVRAFTSGSRSGSAEAIREDMSLLLTGGSYIRTAKVDGNRFTFTGLEPGRYSLSVSTEMGAGNTAASAPASDDVVLRILPRSSLALHVRGADGRRLSGGLSMTHSEGKSVRLLRDGEVTATGLVPGEHELSFSHDDGPTVSRTVMIAAGKNELTWVVSNESMKISGKVRDAATGAALRGVQISAPTTDAYGWDRSGAFVQTDESGQFSIDVATPDAFLFVHHPGYASTVVRAGDVRSVFLTSGEESDQVRKEDYERGVQEPLER